MGKCCRFDGILCDLCCSCMFHKDCNLIRFKARFNILSNRNRMLSPLCCHRWRHRSETINYDTVIRLRSCTRSLCLNALPPILRMPNGSALCWFLALVHFLSLSRSIIRSIAFNASHRNGQILIIDNRGLMTLRLVVAVRTRWMCALQLFEIVSHLNCGHASQSNSIRFDSLGNLIKY